MLKHLAAFHGRAKIGNRDVVGFGLNGSYMYVERCDYPMPAIRFRENTPESDALRAKEKEDWKKLTLEEKKACKYIFKNYRKIKFGLDLFAVKYSIIFSRNIEICLKVFYETLLI